MPIGWPCIQVRKGPVMSCAVMPINSRRHTADAASSRTGCCGGSFGLPFRPRQNSRNRITGMNTEASDRWKFRRFVRIGPRPIDQAVKPVARSVITVRAMAQWRTIETRPNWSLVSLSNIFFGSALFQELHVDQELNLVSHDLRGKSRQAEITAIDLARGGEAECLNRIQILASPHELRIEGHGTGDAHQ